MKLGFSHFFLQFLGSTDVDQPKGIEVVKEGIRKLRFSQQLRKAEGQRTPKVELTVSVDGVAIQEPKGKVSGVSTTFESCNPLYTWLHCSGSFINILFIASLIALMIKRKRNFLVSLPKKPIRRSTLVSFLLVTNW